MKMLVLIFRQSLEPDLMKVLDDLDVKAFTQASTMEGAGDSGTTLHSYGRNGHNSMILAAMDDEKAAMVAKRLKTFFSIAQRHQQSGRTPLRLFAIPCECLI
jgi:hypothetical protein